MKLLPVLLLPLLLAACGGGDSAGRDSDQGREETRTIRNTEHIGYSGDAIADKVDGALDANDRRREQLDEAEDGR